MEKDQGEEEKKSSGIERQKTCRKKETQVISRKKKAESRCGQDRDCKVTEKERQVQQKYKKGDLENKREAGGGLQEEAVRKQSIKSRNITVDRSSSAVRRKGKKVEGEVS